MSEETSTNHLELATELTIAWLDNPNTRVSADEVPAFLEKMHGAVTALSATPAPTEEAAPKAEYTPAVTVRRSLASKDHLISMIDGKPYKTLKRHLSGHGLTPEQYRERYGLKADYPMVAENYAEMRRGIAKKLGLGRKPGAKAAPKAAAASATATPKAVRSPRKVAAKPAEAAGKSEATSSSLRGRIATSIRAAVVILGAGRPDTARSRA